MPQTLSKKEKKAVAIPAPRGPNRSFCSIRFLPLVFVMAFFLSACVEAVFVDWQIPGRNGLVKTLQLFETGVKWKTWPLLLESYYLSDHADEAKKSYKNDLMRWFLADKFTAAVFGDGSKKPRVTCILAMREKHFSPNFKPHFVVYYRIQKTLCQEEQIFPSSIITEGQMEWGFDTKKKRWIHLRKLG